MKRAVAIASAFLASAAVGWAACGDDTATSEATTASTGGSAGTSGSGAEGGGGQGGGGAGTGGDQSPQPACDAPAVSPSMGACVTLTAGAGGGGGFGGGEGGAPPGIECNPVTNEPCTAGMDLVCDIAGSVGFKCWPTARPGELCDDCNQGGMMFCGAGMTCVGVHACARYCCEDGDCGSGTCVKELEGADWFPQAPGLGLCLLPQ
jgi:hypothetical protein